MRFSISTIGLLVTMTLSGMSSAADVTVQSGPARAYLLELFTSEGCSSCPPAEKWFSTLRQSPRLWKDLVPVSFHVDYWDGLGWRDPLASKAATERQRAYAKSWHSDTVYTPGFVVNGQEWKARDLSQFGTAESSPGNLTATLHENGEVLITFAPTSKPGSKWQAHAALLAYDYVCNVKAGENSGERLVHDFAVVAHEAAAMRGTPAEVMVRLPAEQVKHGKSALAVWITEEGGVTPVQAAGGDL